MKLKLVTAALLGLSLSSVAFAEGDFTIKDIRVEGLQRTEPGTVFNYLPIKVGDSFSSDKARESIKSLFATGFFDDVRVETEGNDVIISVVERPILTELNISGAKELKNDQVKKSLEASGLAPSRPFDQALLSNAIVSLKQEYVNRGKYAAEITPTVTKLERNRVAVSLAITEGKSAKIKKIDIIGNSVFSDRRILKEMSLTTGGMFTWISGSNQYSKQKLSADLEKIKALYQNNGYLEFNLDSTQVELSPDKADIYLNINVTEGRKFKIGQTKFIGDLKEVPQQDLDKLLTVKEGDVFNRSKLADNVTAIQGRFGNDGYAMANINVIPDINEETAVADFTFAVDPGPKVYVNKINISGNNKTRDEVIRRELRQVEGSVYDMSKIQRSKERIELLGYFDNVTVESPNVPNTNDQVDLNVNVAERNTGTANVGIGYVQGEGVQFTGSISQSNIFGSGKAVSLSASTGDANKHASLSFTDPYFTVDGVSVGYDAYWRVYDPNNIDTSRYKTDTLGVAARLGVPITEYDRINFSLGAERTKVTLYDNSPFRYVDFVNRYGASNTTFIGTIGWGRDKRDSALWPTRGYIMRANAEAGLPGGDIQYYRLTHQQTWFFPLSQSFTLMVNGEIGYADGYSKTSELPFFQNFYLGGIGSVRGYENSSLGPKDTDDEYLGGSRKVVGNVELLFPMPGLKDTRSVRMSLFADAGSLWDKNKKWNYGSTTEDGGFKDELRYSVGLGLTWLSPMGPLKFSYAQPINKKDQDKVQRFQFQMGATF
ncbi:outer membrane protein assembly factor BamA [Neisseria sp. Ec49-e6-T10]|uniref:outer membrane protein assembly factor BamA n=1 Tax=Neisseria sp. Ec49-e6-T10 TaxID=3140744 RepID=UPI003EBBB31F